MSSNMAAQSTMSSDHIDRRPRSSLRLRRIISLALLSVLLAVVSSIVWYLYRPLTGIEQRLVGTWRTTTNPTTSLFTFHSDRTVTSPRHPPGRWSVHGSRLYETDAAVVELLRTLFRNRNDDSMELTFIDDDHISINGGAQQWQRVSTE